jgi:hypothetical protein
VSAATSRVIDGEWWNKDGDELAETLGVVFRTVRDENEWRTDKDEYHWGLYEGTGDGGVTLKSRRNLTYLNATLPDNVCKMAVDTLTAKVATIRPIPQVLTSKGNYKDQRRARKLRQLIQGEFYRQTIHEKIASRIIKDALVSRGGVVQVYVDGKKPKVERVHIWTLFTDEWDAEFGAPNVMFRIRTMDRRQAMRKFGKTPALKEKIKDAGFFSSSTRWIRDEERSSTVERVELLEAWYRCPDHDNEEDDHECIGRHVIICEGAVLFDEPWEHDYFPFALLTYDTPSTGYWGTGLVQTLEGYQVSIDKANEKLDTQYDNSGVGVILRDGGGIMKSDVVDGVRVLQVRPGGYDPTVFDMDLVNEHMRMRPMELVERALNAAGVSQMAAQSKKPAGVDAAVALQTLDDIESQRHIVFGRRFESWCMDVSRLLIECVKDIAKNHGDYAVKVPLKGAYLDLKWSEVHVDGFQLEMQSVGQLFTSFAGRIEKLKALFEMGTIDGDTFVRNMDAGDLQAEIELKLAPRILVDEMIESMLDAEDNPANDYNDVEPDGFIAPNEFLPLDWAHERAHLRRLEAQMNGAPEKVLDLLRRFIDALDQLIARRDGRDPLPMTADGGPVDPTAPPPIGPQPPPPGGGMPVDPMMMPQAVTPAGDQLMQPPPGVVPPMAA